MTHEWRDGERDILETEVSLAEKLNLGLKTEQ